MANYGAVDDQSRIRDAKSDQTTIKNAPHYSNVATRMLTAAVIFVTIAASALAFTNKNKIGDQISYLRAG
jgi:hypothetical protein